MIAYIILGTLIVSQLVPTFGSQLGIGGTGIPLFVAMGGYGIGFIAILFQSTRRKLFINLTLYLLVGMAWGGLTTVFSPFLSTFRDASIVIKAIVMYLAFFAGYSLYKNDRDFTTLLKIFILIFFVHIFLYFDHLSDPNGPIQGLYHFKNFYDSGYHKNRFPGTWGFPYPEALFLISTCLAFVYASLKTKDVFFKLFLILMALGGLYMALLGTQSRANMVSIGLSLVYAGCLYLLYSVTINRAKHIAISLMFVVLVFFCVTTFATVLQDPYFQHQFQHLTKIDRVLNNISEFNRVNDLWVLLDFVAEDPIRLFIGFGGARSFQYAQIYLESILNYIFNYGLIGFLLIMFPWFYLWFKTISDIFIERKKQDHIASLFIHVFITYTFLMCMSADMFTHYRFIPLYYLLLGMYFKRHDLLYRKGK